MVDFIFNFAVTHLDLYAFFRIKYIAKYMTDLSEGFWMGVLATGAGIIGLIIRALSKSKCDEISCMGLHIDRRVDLEVDDIESKSTTEPSRNVI